MITIGVDFHKHTSSFEILDDDGHRLRACKLANEPGRIRELLTELPGPRTLAMEATRNWGIMYECVKDLVDDFQLGHPKKMKAITHSETKNDKKDAEMIAKLAYSGFLPKAHVSSMDTRQLRSLLRFRAYCVRKRSSVRHQVQTLLDRNLWACHRPKSFKDPFCKKGLAWLGTLPLPERERFILNQCLGTHGYLEESIEEIERYAQEQTIDLPGLIHLRTVPGMKTSKVNAFVVLLEADDISRFHKARHFAHYAGLIPSENSSGERHHHGRLVKSANMHLRTALMESAFAAIKVDAGLRSYYEEVQARRGPGCAIVAVARKLSYAIYYVLREKRAYRPEPLKQSPVAVSSPSAAPWVKKYALKG